MKEKETNIRIACVLAFLFITSTTAEAANCIYSNKSDKPWTIEITLSQGTIDGNEKKSISLAPNQILPSIELRPAKNSPSVSYQGHIEITDGKSENYSFDLIEKNNEPYISYTGPFIPVTLNQPDNCNITIEKNSSEEISSTKEIVYSTSLWWTLGDSFLLTTGLLLLSLV